MTSKSEIICAQGDGASVCFCVLGLAGCRSVAHVASPDATKEQVTTQRLWSRALQFQEVKTFAQVPSSMGAAWLCLGSTRASFDPAADGGNKLPKLKHKAFSWIFSDFFRPPDHSLTTSQPLQVRHVFLAHCATPQQVGLELQPATAQPNA